MAKIWIYSKFKKNSKRIKTHYHELDHFPNWNEMIEFCTKDNIRASDFTSKPIKGDRKNWVGKIVIDGGAKSITGGRRYGQKFYVFCDKEPTYEEMAR